MTWETYGLYLAVLAAFFATPPDTSQLLVIARSLNHGPAKALWTIAGDLSANILQMTAAAFGLAALVAGSAEVLSLVKWAGAAYLAWIGLRLLISAPPSGPGTAAPTPRRHHFLLGFLTSAANPYAIIFFAALFPQFLDPTTPILPQLAILGLTYLVVDGAILLAFALGAHRLSTRLKTNRSPWPTRISGALMIGAAALLGLRDLNMEPQK